MAISKVKVSASMKFPFVVIPKQQGTKTIKQMAVVRVEAPATMESHIPIDLVVVLDMAGASSSEKSSMLDMLKKAIKFIIKNLDNNDYLTILTFGKRVEIFRKDWASAKKMVDELVVGHTTGSRSGLEEAVKNRQSYVAYHCLFVVPGSDDPAVEVKHDYWFWSRTGSGVCTYRILDSRSNIDMKRQGFIILVSDRDSRMSNCSDDGPGHALVQKYPVHTFSLGKAEDPSELVSIAEKSKGTFSCISGNSKIMEAFAICLAGLKSVFAVDARVEISPQKSRNVKITPVEIDNTGFRMEGSNIVLLGVLYAGEVKDLIIEIEFTVGCLEGFRSVHVLTATVDYKDVQRPKPECKMAVHFCATSFARDCTNERTPFPMVVQQMARFDVLKRMREIRGELDAEKKNIEIKLLYEAWRKLEISKWEKTKNPDNFSSWREAQSVGVDLGRIENDIHAMVSCLKRGLGLGCIYSWVSSYQMQRATTTGLPTTSSFLTPAMEEMVHKARTQSEEDAAAMTSAASAGTRLALPTGEGRIVEVLERIAKRLEDMETKLDSGEPSRNTPETQPYQAEGNQLAAGERTHTEAADPPQTSKSRHEKKKPKTTEATRPRSES